MIPARGGSKRLPRKNLAEFLGQPIIVHTIAAALACEDLFQQVIVSTEDDEIGAIARAAGATLAARPTNLASDSARVAEVCLDLLDSEAVAGRQYDILCCLYPTAPLRDADDIRATMALIAPGRHDFALAVTSYDLPPHQALHMGKENELEPLWPELINQRADETGELACDNGSTYCATVAAFRRTHSFYGPGLRGHWMPRSRSVDIDLREDLELARHYATLADTASVPIEQNPTRTS